jgi:hypothetical protein
VNDPVRIDVCNECKATAHTSQVSAIRLLERKNNEVLHHARRRRSNCLGVTATQTVTELQSQGFDVIVNKVGTAPLDKCVVNAVRQGQTFSRMDSGSPGAMDDVVTTVTAKTVYVDVAC